jgi:NAD(P)-dependent dehydrogenase (short-subunit alcohol dehydrogenase family)
MVQIDGSVAVLTGAGSGIGRATALALGAAGAAVVVSDVDGARADAVAAEVAALGARSASRAVDVREVADFEALRDLAVDRFGRVDIVMNNVGVLSVGQPEAIPLADWARVLDVNLMSFARSNAVFLPLLLEQGQGHVVNTASTAGLYAYSYDRLPYSATKGAVIALSEALALYLKPRGIGVTCLCPGPVATNIVEQITFHGDVGGVRAPALPILDAAVVGAQVVDAIRTDRFLLLTHPDEVHEILVRRAADPDAFVASQIADMT